MAKYRVKNTFRHKGQNRVYNKDEIFETDDADLVARLQNKGVLARGQHAEFLPRERLQAPSGGQGDNPSDPAEDEDVDDDSDEDIDEEGDNLPEEHHDAKADHDSEPATGKKSGGKRRGGKKKG